ncbi:bifunctional hydroxymethylpyrimidine kinase/phosphomethylpyrimidine kinase [Myceligenerans salitolerans]|uniref:Bifunctional hydroxymethylpyrimidine kinase/phosphomethylpyrimidine kinase n=1 Tax=Myceligenerans salitolerans TaxID=1230528 RepID=A0ABS3IB99_9MICO|nr:bifunctional hydroxymethylpyrimidine kinase/phosphomethylpyrimidine kinase [Myceligenerans salitolerans]MBO0610260.1 bifunctional hydroxymethylpyrimidine kinase/phosphomethylpyrimidine kinase [Myceligenerans salitolerans]
MSVPRVLSIAGSDPSGGAGVQADLKSIAAHGGYGMAVITALTAQNTHGVQAVHAPPAAFVAQQLDAVSDDIDIDAVKIGMLGTARAADVVGAWLERVRPPVVVLDPVMIATSGDRLLEPRAEAALRDLLSLADVVTPNIPELAVLTGGPEAVTWEQAVAQAREVAAVHDVLVLAKGGHLLASDTPDALVSAHGEVAAVSGPRLVTTSTHGTGCSLSSAMATLRVVTGSWPEALRRATTWLRAAIARGESLRVGGRGGHGPVDHLGMLWDAAGVRARALEA